MKKIIAVFFVLAMLLTSCNNAATDTDNNKGPKNAPVPEGVFSDFDLDTEAGPAPTTITFSKDKAEIDGSGAVLADGVLTIDRAGAYILSGDFKGSVCVDADKKDDVHLILNGVNITSETAAINGVSSDKIVITLASGTENTVTDGTSYFVNPGDEPNACIFSDDDLTINGTGNLIVNANCNNGIDSKNDLRIVSGAVSVTAVKNALKGKDSVVIGDGNLILDAGKDAIKSDNETDTERGYISIYGGVIVITSEDDGIQAVNAVSILGGTVRVHAADTPVNCDKTPDIVHGCLIEE